MTAMKREFELKQLKANEILNRKEDKSETVVPPERSLIRERHDAEF